MDTIGTLNLVFVSLIALFAVVLIFFKGPSAGFLLMVFLLPLTRVYVDVGFSLSAARIVAFILSIFCSGLFFTKCFKSKPQSLALIYFLYASSITILGSLIAPYTPLDTSELRVKFRPILQIVSMFLQMLPFFLAPLLIKTKEDIFLSLRVFFASILLMDIIGIAQWLIKMFWDINILPLYHQGIFGDMPNEGSFLLNEDFVFRVNSLGNEPKYLAEILSVSLIIWLIFLVLGIVRKSWFSYFFISLTAIVILLTFATTGFIIMALGLCVIMITWVIKKFILEPYKKIEIQKRFLTVDYIVLTAKQCGKVTAISGLLLMLFILGVYGVWFFKNNNLKDEIISNLTEIWNVRVLTRLGDLEEYDAITIDFLLNEPKWMFTGVGGGNLPHYAYPYLPNDPEILDYVTNLTWDPKSGFLRMIGCFGLVGLFFFGLILATIFKRLWQNSKSRGTVETRMIFGSIIVVFFVTTIYCLRNIDYYFWFIIGLAISPGIEKAFNANEGV